MGAHEDAALGVVISLHRLLRSLRRAGRAAPAHSADPPYSFSYFPPARVEQLLAEAGLVQVAEYEISLARPRPDSDEGQMRPGGDEDGDRTRLVVVRKSSVTR